MQAHCIATFFVVLLTLRTAAIERAQKEGFDARFSDRGTMVLENFGPVVRQHSASKRVTWHNHLQVFHPLSIASEYAVTAERIGHWRARLLSIASSTLVHLYTLLAGEESIGQYALYSNGTAVPRRTMDAIRSTIWKHTVVYPYEKGDVVFIDNQRVAHGRQPYSASEVRKVYVSWAAD